MSAARATSAVTASAAVGASAGTTATAAIRSGHRAGPDVAGGVSLGSTLRELAEVLAPREVELGTPSGPQWATGEHLITPDGITATLARIRQAHGASPEIAASYLANWYSANVVAPAIAAFVIFRRVPDLSPAGLSLRVLDNGWFDRTAFHRGAMTVLPGDPAVTGPAGSGPAGSDTAGSDTAGNSGLTGDEAGRDGAAGGGTVSVVPDLTALRGALVDGVLSHLRPLVDELRGRVRLGYPALWGAVAAQCARAFLLTERATGDPVAGRAEADAFFARAAPTMRNRPRWHEFVHRGRPYTGMRCGSCCLAHRLGEDYCTSCPFTADHEREARLRAWIDTQGNGGLAV